LSRGHLVLPSLQSIASSKPAMFGGDYHKSVFCTAYVDGADYGWSCSRWLRAQQRPDEAGRHGQHPKSTHALPVTYVMIASVHAERGSVPSVAPIRHNVSPRRAAVLCPRGTLLVHTPVDVDKRCSGPIDGLGAEKRRGPPPFSSFNATRRLRATSVGCCLNKT